MHGDLDDDRNGCGNLGTWGLQAQMCTGLQVTEKGCVGMTKVSRREVRQRAEDRGLGTHTRSSGPAAVRTVKTFSRRFEDGHCAPGEGVGCGVQRGGGEGTRNTEVGQRLRGQKDMLRGHGPGEAPEKPLVGGTRISIAGGDTL